MRAENSAGRPAGAWGQDRSAHILSQVAEGKAGWGTKPRQGSLRKVAEDEMIDKAQQRSLGYTIKPPQGLCPGGSAKLQGSNWGPS